MLLHIGDDALLDVCHFLSRKQLAMGLEPTNWHIHQLLTANQNQFHATHIIYKPLVVRLPNFDGGGLFKLIKFNFKTGLEPFVSSSGNKDFYESRSMDELPPAYVRCTVIKVNDIGDARIMHFLQRAKHVFYEKVEIYFSLEMPSPFFPQIFGLIHPAVHSLSIRIVIPSWAEPKLKGRNDALLALWRRMRSGEITIQQYDVECHQVLDAFNLAITSSKLWLANSPFCEIATAGNEVHVNEQKNNYFNQIGKALCTQWLLYRPHGDNEETFKRLSIWDESNMMVPTVREILTQMHRQIQADIEPLERSIDFILFFKFVKDLIEGSTLQFVNKKVSIINSITGESLHARMVDITPNLSGQLIVHYCRKEDDQIYI